MTGSLRHCGADVWPARQLFLIIAFSLVVPLVSFAATPTTLAWNTNRNRVTADIQSGQLLDVLRRVAASTGWKVYVEPGTLHPVSAKFKDLPPGEALRLLLGDINFALVPGTNAVSRLFVFRTDRQSATELVLPGKPDGSRRIQNELIVRLKPGANIDEIAKLLGAKVTGRIDKLGAYRLQFENETAANAARDALSGNPDIASTDNNYSIDPPRSPLGAPGGVALPQLQLRPPPDTGKVIIGLVDTAVQSLGNNLDQFIQKPISLAGAAQLDPNSPSHGTAMAETILSSLQQVTQGSTSVQILPIDIYGPGHATTSFDVANGIIAAVNGGARVVNLSLGSPDDSVFLHEVVRAASAANVLLISAAGNEPVTTPFYPAAYPEVRAVTAIDNGEIAPYASRGSYVSLGAPGLNLVPFGRQAFGVEGTSVSSAIISGAAAGFMEANRANTSQAQSFLQRNFGFSAGH